MSSEKEIDITGGGAEGGHGGGGKKSKKKLIVILLIVVLLLAGGGAAAFFMMKKKGHDKKGHDKEETSEEEKPEVPEVNTYVEVKPEFLAVIKNPDGSKSYVRIGLSLLVNDPLLAKQIEENMPPIRSKINAIMADQNIELLRTPFGKENLKTALEKSLQEFLKKEFKKEGLKAVLFQNLVMQ